MDVHELALLPHPIGRDVISDAALEAALERIITGQQAAVDADLATGRNLQVNETLGSRRLVHLATCHMVVDRLDRRSCWIPDGWSLEDVRNAISRHGHDPKMPYLLSEDELEDLSSYHACRICQPGLRRPEKAFDATRRAVNPDNLGQKHISRFFTGPANRPPFELVRIERTITAQGTKTTLFDHSGRIELADGDPVVVLPRDRRRS